MRLGKAAMEALQAEICGQLSPGNELVVAGAVALKGTALIAKEKHEILREHFSQGFLYDSENMQESYGVGENPEESAAWETAKKAGATALYAMGEGGFLSALWKWRKLPRWDWKWILPKCPSGRKPLRFVRFLM